MASRFWAGAGSGSSSGSESGSDSGSSAAGDKAQQRRQWALDSDSDSEDQVRVVKSAKDRAWEAVRSAVSKSRAKMKINDWNGIQTEFEDLNKHVVKNQALIAKEGVPKFYIKLLTDLEDLLSETLKDKAAVKKMSATNTRALNRMKLSLKKHNKAYEADIAACREDPAAYEEEEEDDDASSSDAESSSDASDSESESEDSDEDGSKDGSDEESGDESGGGSDAGSDADSEEEKPKAAKPSKAKKPQRALDEVDSDEEWPSESESESESDEDVGDMPKGRAFWLKKTVDDDKKKKKDEKKAGKIADQEKRKREKVIEVRAPKAGPAAATLKLDADMAPEDMDKKLLEVLASRGRKGSDPKDVLRQLQALAYIARRFGPVKEIPVVLHLVSAMYDTLRNIDDYLDVGTWKSCHGYLMRVTKVLEAHPNMRLGQVAQEDIADLVLASRGEVKERPDNVNEDAATTGVIKVVGTLLSLVQRLEEEYTKSCQQINPHTSEYISRLRDEAAVISLAAEVQKYYERQGDVKSAAVMSLLQVEHMYYKHDSIALAVHKAQAYSTANGNPADLHPASRGTNESEAAAVASALAAKDWAKVHPAAAAKAAGAPAPAAAAAAAAPPDYSVKIAELCTYIYTHGDDRCKTRAMLCHIYHQALHDRFYAARDLLLMSHLQDSIGQTDVATQILYNRMMVTLGLCAFRAGLITETHDCLRDVCSSRVKELLAQGVQIGRFQDKNPEQEKAERRRQVPYHMHINMDLLECCHLTAAMLLEVPNMAQEVLQNDVARRRTLSKQFRRFLDIYNRQVFTGPPENIRDHVIAAAKCLASGEWEQCAKLLLGLDVWALIPGAGAADRVKKMLKERIQAEALRTYLFTYAAYYESLSLPRLCAMFGVGNNVAHAVISKMMLNQEIYGSWDEPTNTIVLHKVEPSHLQLLALQFADKAATLVESNERLLDSRTGGYGYRNDKNWGRPTFGGQQDWGDRKGFNSDKWKTGGGAAYRGGSSSGGRGRGGGRGSGSYLGRGTADYRGDRVQRDEKRSRGLF